MRDEDEFSSKRMNKEDLEYLFKQVERDWPVRCKLAELAGFKANPKNPRALIDSPFDLNIYDLYLEVLFRQPQNAEEALKIIRANQAAVDAHWIEYQTAVKTTKDAKRKK